MSRLYVAAAHLFKRYPFATNCSIYGALYMGAELTQQIVKRAMQAPEEKKPIDFVVIRRFALMGTAIYGPTLYAWYKWLDGTFPGTARRTILKKLVLDQFVLTPICLTLFYTGMSIMEGSDDIFAELREKYAATFLRSCCFWLPAQTLNFSFVAPRFRIIYMGLCGVGWIHILCYLKRQNLHTDTAAVIAPKPEPVDEYDDDIVPPEGPPGPPGTEDPKQKQSRLQQESARRISRQD
ncbi:hypothetical protein KR222_008465 [Zaprionus bogoriensis]|nr:hypothetical protein KR222_008465 [Zaprionus bogoriensis]